MKALKKTLSLVLAVCMLASMAVLATATASANASDQLHRKLVTDVVNSDEKVETHSYMFYVPQDWRNEYNDYYNYNPETKSFDGAGGNFAAGIYWWEGPYNCNDYQGELDNAWPGYAVTETVDGNPNIFRADVPVNAGKFIWNNLVDGGMDNTLPVYTAAIQSMDIGNEYYDPNEDGYGFYPDGIPEGFDGMIFVCNPKATEENPLTHKYTYKGVWFYYYGNGEYGIYKTRDEAAAANAVLKDGEFPSYGLDINNKDVELTVGEEDTITVNDSDAKATIADATVASISQNATGVVTVKGLKVGTTKITFSLEKNGELETVEANVTVKAAPKPVVTKKANTIKVTSKNKTYKASKLKKKAQSYKAITVKNAKGTVKYTVTKKNSKLTFKNGKVTVKKKTKKGTYKITVKVTAAGNASYKAKSVSKTITVKVKK